MGLLSERAGCLTAKTIRRFPARAVLNQSGFPWFGDEMELLLDAAGPPAQCTPKSPGVVGNESEWQMVLNLEKSRLGGLGVGGLMEGEPRSLLSAWNNYQSFIKTGRMQGAAKVSHLEKGANQWVAEWKVAFDLMQITPGKPYSVDMEDTQMGINIALGDVDTPAEVRNTRAPPVLLFVFRCIYRPEIDGPRVRPS
jgi:SSS family solute:Na+ symporter